MDPSLSQALHLMNGDTVSNKIAQGGIVRTAIAAGKTPEQIVGDLYVRCVSRKPTADEVKAVMDQYQKAGADKALQQQIVEDVFWALLNSKEFMFNH